MAVRSLRRISTFVWVPPTSGLIYKIIVEKPDSTTYDITDFVIEGDVTDGVTETIGNFNITVDNSTSQYSGLFEVYDSLKIYLDYSDTASTLRFHGKIEKISTQQDKLVISGRSLAVRVLGITVTREYLGQYTNDILLDLLSNYSSYVTTTNVDTTTSTDTQISVTWNNKPFWDCIQELCTKSGREAYIDSNLDFHYFVTGTVNNSTDAIVHDYNLIETGEFAPDLSVVKNRVVVYGSKIGNIHIIATAEDSTSIQSAEAGGYDVKELIINDSNITTVEQAQAKADYELSAILNPPIIGDVTSLGLATLQPGERLHISDPLSQISPGYYTIQKYSHSFSNDEPMQTTVTILKEINTISKVLKKRISFEADSTDKSNINEMKFSWLFDFNTDTGTHSSTTIVDGVLKTDGSASGTWISELNTLDDNANYAEIRSDGSSLSGTTYSVSTDGGITWQSLTPNTSITLSPPGIYIKLKVDLNSDTTQIDSLGLLYK